MILKYFFAKIFKMDINLSFNKFLEQIIKTFIKKISDECDVEQSKLETIWNDTFTSLKINISVTANTGCCYIIQRGKNAGNRCGCKVKDSSNYCAKHQQKEKKIIIRKHTSGKFWHPETQFVFESEKNKIVIGKIIDEDIKDLSKSDIDICKKWKFPYKE